MNDYDYLSADQLRVLADFEYKVREALAHAERDAVKAIRKNCAAIVGMHSTVDHRQPRNFMAAFFTHQAGEEGPPPNRVGVEGDYAAIAKYKDML